MKDKQMFSMQRKVFVVGLPQNVEGSELKAFFQKYGEIEYSNVITENVTDKPKSNKIVTYLYIQDLVLLRSKMSYLLYDV